MWHSKDDLIEDLASLNDFGVPGDKEPYKVLYSKGRGKNLCEKPEYPKTYVDYRTGETIKLEDMTFDTDKTWETESRGRGRAKGSFKTNLIENKIKLQLQKQLRLARPLGSSDAVIEQYYKNSVPIEKDETKVLNFKPIGEAKEITLDQPVDSVKKFQRIKAVRRSNAKSNALLERLLLKSENQKNSSEDQTESYDRSKAESSSSENSSGCSSVDSNKSDSSETFNESDSFKIINEFDKCSDLDCNCSQIRDSLENCITFKVSNNLDESSVSEKIKSKNSNGEIKNCDEAYRKAGEKLSRMCQRSGGSGIYDFSQALKYIPPNSTEDDSYSDYLFDAESSPKGFVCNEKDFPPLSKRN